jgi:hypothetical protein
VERRRALRGRRYTANAVQDLPSDAARLTANVYERIIMSDDVSNTYAMKNVPGSLHPIKTLLPKEKKTLKIISISKNTPPPLSRLRKLHKKNNRTTRLRTITTNHFNVDERNYEKNTNLLLRVF